MKEWTLQTLIAQLRNKLIHAGAGDILDDSDDTFDKMSVNDMVDLLKEADFRKRMTQIEGQQAIYVDDRGNISTGDAPKPEDVAAAKAKRTGKTKDQSEGEDHFAMAAGEDDSES